MSHGHVSQIRRHFLDSGIFRSSSHLINQFPSLQGVAVITRRHLVIDLRRVHRLLTVRNMQRFKHDELPVVDGASERVVRKVYYRLRHTGTSFCRA
jgi:hypothetical protein